MTVKSVASTVTYAFSLTYFLFYKFIISELTHDMLSGHRNRFYPMFRRLKKFFFDAATLSYVTALISVPKLPNVCTVPCNIGVITVSVHKELYYCLKPTAKNPL